MLKFTLNPLLPANGNAKVSQILGITKERKKELIDMMHKELRSKDSIVSALIASTESCNLIEEVAYVNFMYGTAIGEMHGTMKTLIPLLKMFSHHPGKDEHEEET